MIRDVNVNVLLNSPADESAHVAKAEQEASSGEDSERQVIFPVEANKPRRIAMFFFKAPADPLSQNLRDLFRSSFPPKACSGALVSYS